MQPDSEPRTRMAVMVRGLLLAAILVCGGFWRFDGLRFGLPEQYHPDEGAGANAVSDCMMGRAISSRYRHPPFLNVLACRLDRYVVAPYTSRYMRYTPHNILSLRLVSAAAGTLTTLFVYLLGRRLLSPAGALGAAFLFACFPAAVMSSKYGVPDSLVTMFMVAALWLQLRMLEQPLARRYFAAALATTLAVGSKYNGGFVAIPFVVAHLTAAFRRRVVLWSPACIGASLLAIAVGLALSFPRVVFEGDGANLLAGLFFEQKHLTVAGHHGIAISGLEGGYVFHFVHSILPAAGPVLMALIVVGLANLALRGTAAAGILWSFALPYYFTIESIYKVPPSFERYALPLLPVYFIAAVALLERLIAVVPAIPHRARTVLLSAGLAVAALVPVSRTVVVVAQSHEDTRKKMTRWMRQNLPSDTEVFGQWPMMYFYYPQPPSGGRLRPANEMLLLRPPRGKELYVVASSLMYQRYLDYPDDAPTWSHFYRRIFERGELVHEEQAGTARYMFHNPTLRLYRLRGS